MGRKNGLTALQTLILGAIFKRGHLYSGPKQLSLNILGNGSSPTERLKISARAGLKFIELIFDSIDVNGNVAGGEDAPEYQKEFLKEIKKFFSTFQEFKDNTQEFLNKR